MPTVKRAFKYRFYPSQDQIPPLEQTFGCTRFVYNWALSLSKAAYKTGQTRLDYCAISATLTRLKRDPEHLWLNEVSCVPLQQSLRHLQTAYIHFFKHRNRFPTFKRRHEKQSAEFTRSGFRCRNGELFLAKFKKPLAIRWSRKLPCEPSTVTVTRDLAGRYFVSFLCEYQLNLLPTNTKTVEINPGLQTDAACKSGNPSSIAHYERKLVMARRRLSKKKQGSRNRLKAKRNLAKIQTKLADCKNDFTHKLTTQLIHENQVIRVGSLQAKAAVKNKRSPESISDCNWNELTRQLQYKSQWYGRTLITMDPWFSSCKTSQSHCECKGTPDDLTVCRRIKRGPGHDDSQDPVRDVIKPRGTRC